MWQTQKILYLTLFLLIGWSRLVRSDDNNDNNVAHDPIMDPIMDPINPVEKPLPDNHQPFDQHPPNDHNDNNKPTEDHKYFLFDPNQWIFNDSMRVIQFIQLIHVSIIVLFTIYSGIWSLRMKKNPHKVLHINQDNRIYGNDDWYDASDKTFLKSERRLLSQGNGTDFDTDDFEEDETDEEFNDDIQLFKDSQKK
eukprot:UN08272